MTYIIRTIGLLVVPDGESVFASERATRVSIDDEDAGEFVEVHQDGRDGIQIDPDEWPVLREAIDRMIGECRAIEG